MTKDTLQMAVAIALLLSAVVLSYLSFFLSDCHEIAQSVLWYFAQTLLYSGGILGIRSYTITRIGDVNAKTDTHKL